MSDDGRGAHTLSLEKANGGGRIAEPGQWGESFNRMLKLQYFENL